MTSEDISPKNDHIERHSGTDAESVTVDKDSNSVKVGDVEGGIHDSTIAGRDVIQISFLKLPKFLAFAGLGGVGIIAIAIILVTIYISNISGVMTGLLVTIYISNISGVMTGLVAFFTAPTPIPTVTPSPTLTLIPTSTATSTPVPTPTPPFKSRIDDEILIVIIKFHIAQNVEESEIHKILHDDITQRANDYKIPNLRVEVYPTSVDADTGDETREIVKALGESFNASMVIWGAETRVNLEVNFLNLQQLDFPAADTRLGDSLAKIAVLSSPEPYAYYVTEKLTPQIAFLSLFAIGHSYYLKREYEQALTIIEQAVDSISPEEVHVEGLADCSAGGFLDRRIYGYSRNSKGICHEQATTSTHPRV